MIEIICSDICINGTEIVLNVELKYNGIKYYVRERMHTDALKIYKSLMNVKNKRIAELKKNFKPNEDII